MFELSGVNYEEVLEQGDSILVRVIASSSYRGFELSGLYCINISGFSAKPFRADKPENSRCGGVCLYYKENLPIKERPGLVPIPERIVAELKFQRKKNYFVLSYCHLNGSSEFAEYTKSLENIYESINKENPTLTIINGDFNARSPLFGKMTVRIVEGAFLAIL